MEHVLLDKVDSDAEKAAEKLKKCGEFGVACEGVKLGGEGELCLVQLATSDKAYIFDITALGEKAFSILGLREILEDAGKVKLFYDCRAAVRALKYQYNVYTQGIVDLQLLVVYSYKVNRKSCSTVIGLQECMDVHLKGSGYGDSGKKKEREVSRDSEFWKMRPLSDSAKKYAVKEVEYLAKLKTGLNSKIGVQAVPPYALKEALDYASERYADFARRNEKSSDDSPYLTSARLPERITPDIEPSGGKWSHSPFSAFVGENCRSCSWQTDLDTTRQCRRCQQIDQDYRY